MMKPAPLNYKKEISIYLFQKKLIRAIVCILLLFSILTGLVFYSLEKNSYHERLMDSNDVIVSQISAIYELYIQNIRDLCNRSSLYDNPLLMNDLEYHLSTDGKKETVNYLTGLSVMSEYIHSCYLYFLQDGLVFSSFSMPTTVTQLKTFYDRKIFQNIQDSSSVLLEPRFLDTKSQDEPPVNKPLVITMIIAAPVNSYQKTSYLVINIDARKLYAKIFDELQIKNHLNFYIVGENDNIIFHNNMDYLFTSYKDLENPAGNLITSTAWSSKLNWTFILESTVPPIKSSLIKFCVFIILILMILLLMTATLAISYTIPIKKMLQSSRNLRWRYFLTSEQIPGDAATLQNLNFDAEFPECNTFAVMSFRFSDSVPREKSSETLLQAFHNASGRWNFCFRPVQLAADCFCMILGFSFPSFGTENPSPALMIANDVLDSLEKQLIQCPACSISSLKNSCQLLHEAWLEVCKIDKYSYSLPQAVRCYSKIVSKSGAYTFPEQSERQLINNLLVGNLDTCRFYIKKIFSTFINDSYILENADIQKYLYLIQNNILSHLASMPIPIKADTAFSPESCGSLMELETAFTDYLTKIVDKINSRDSNDKVILYQTVIEYLNQHYQENNICLNMAADYFGLNNNYISKIVKEMTGRSFTNYITFKRIEKGKELLIRNKLTINEISETVGFSYPYYFIRKFKEAEGVTPGQYLAWHNGQDVSTRDSETL